MARKLKARKIDLVEMDKLLKRGIAQTEIAKRFGVSEAAITQAKQKMVAGMSSHAALEAAPEIVTGELRSVNRLDKAGQIIDTLLGRLTNEETLIERIAEAVKISLNLEGVNPKEVEEHLRRVFKIINSNDALVIKGAAEVRGQTLAKLEILTKLYELQGVREWIEELVALLEEVDPALKAEFIQRVRGRQAIRRAVKLEK